jgi:CRP/FNR family transcriptional regulator
MLPKDHPCRSCEVSGEALCRALDVETLADFRNQGRRLHLSGGQTLFHQGDPADCVFSLTSGTVKLYAILPDGRRQIVSFLFPGDFVGLEAGPNHGLTAEAVGTASLCRVLARRFEWFADRYPALADARYRLAATELSVAREKMLMLGRKTAPERMASFLSDIQRRAGFRGRDGARLVPLPMSRGDIADYLGLTKETVSRELTNLRKARIIRPLSRTLLEILDSRRLGAAH